MIGIDVGDLSGKGLPAAKYAALALGTLRGIHKTEQHPNQVMALEQETAAPKDTLQI